MNMPGRSFSAGSKYRYGFNGQENCDEIASGLTTAMYWEYDSRIGRRWNVDPKPETGMSSYSTFFCNPIVNVDIFGDLPTPAEAAQMANDSYNSYQGRRKISGGWVRLKDLGGVKLSDKSTGFKAAVYSRLLTNGKTEYTFATAGTEASMKDINADIKQTYGKSAQYDFAKKQGGVLDGFLGKEKELTFVGHSLGGGEAALNALAYDRKAITFNAAGVGYKTKEKYGLTKKSTDDITAFRVAGEAVGTLQGGLYMKADGKIVNISTNGKLSNGTAYIIDKITTVIAAGILHTMTSVYKALNGSGYRQQDGTKIKDGNYLALPLIIGYQSRLDPSSDNTYNRKGVTLNPF